MDDVRPNKKKVQWWNLDGDTRPTRNTLYTINEDQKNPNWYEDRGLGYKLRCCRITLKSLEKDWELG